MTLSESAQKIDPVRLPFDPASLRGVNLADLGVRGEGTPEEAANDAKSNLAQHLNIRAAMEKAPDVEKYVREAARRYPNAGIRLEQTLMDLQTKALAGDMKGILDIQTQIQGVVALAAGSTQMQVNNSIEEQRQIQLQQLWGQIKELDKEVKKDFNELDPYLTDKERERLRQLEANLKEAEAHGTEAQRVAAERALAQAHEQIAGRVEGQAKANGDTHIAAVAEHAKKKSQETIERTTQVNNLEAKMYGTNQSVDAAKKTEATDKAAGAETVPSTQKKDDKSQTASAVTGLAGMTGLNIAPASPAETLASPATPVVTANANPAVPVKGASSARG